MRNEIKELVSVKESFLRSKGFNYIEVLNKNTFKAENSSREACKIKLTDDMKLVVNGKLYGFYPEYLARYSN